MLAVGILNRLAREHLDDVLDDNVAEVEVLVLLTELSRHGQVAQRTHGIEDGVSLAAVAEVVVTDAEEMRQGVLERGVRGRIVVLQGEIRCDGGNLGLEVGGVA